MARASYVLRIYIAAGHAPSQGVVEKITTFLDGEMPGQYKFEVVDVSKNPEMTREHNLIALPTIIRTLPAPVRKFVGNLADESGRIVGLNLIKTDKTETKLRKARKR
jgi:circadian clock protein KaiB